MSRADPQSLGQLNPIHCCYLYNSNPATPCAKEAEWHIWTPPRPYDVTDACTEHVGELLSDALEFRIYPITALKAELDSVRDLMQPTQPGVGWQNTIVPESPRTIADDRAGQHNGRNVTP